MKKLSFAAGMLTMALIGGLGVTALAATGQMTITVDPVNIQVNGQTFQPKDANGVDVPVFALNGTTYAPLRALAEAYGLTVGYDQEANMATVEKPSTINPSASSFEKHNISLVKNDEKYYYFYQSYEKDNPWRFPEYYTMLVDGEELVFCYDISALPTGSYYLYDYPAYYALALAQDTYGTTTAANPNVDGSIKINNLQSAYSSVVKTGKDETQYLTASETFTPQWMECNGVKVYNNASPERGLYEVDGIRYYNSTYICLNDLFAKVGFDYGITIGEYQGLEYIEITK